MNREEYEEQQEKVLAILSKNHSQQLMSTIGRHALVHGKTFFTALLCPVLWSRSNLDRFRLPAPATDSTIF